MCGMLHGTCRERIDDRTIQSRSHLVGRWGIISSFHHQRGGSVDPWRPLSPSRIPGSVMILAPWVLTPASPANLFPVPRLRFHAGSNWGRGCRQPHHASCGHDGPRVCSEWSMPCPSPCKLGLAWRHCRTLEMDTMTSRTSIIATQTSAHSNHGPVNLENRSLISS